jgi:hypothetical protein
MKDDEGRRNQVLGSRTPDLLNAIRAPLPTELWLLQGAVNTTRYEVGVVCRWRSDVAGCMLRAMRSLFNQTDFSVVVKNRAPPPKSWRWEIYRAGRNSPIERSSVFYETVAAAQPGRQTGACSRLTNAHSALFRGALFVYLKNTTSSAIKCRYSRPASGAAPSSGTYS